MWTFDEESAKRYKKIEADFNREILSMMNNMMVVSKFGQAMEDHLDEVVAIRKLTKSILEKLGLPERDEIIVLSKRVINLEARLDQLDDLVYDSMLEMRAYQDQLRNLSKELAELSANFDDDVLE
ncbi:hypothetical protein M3182_07535 [Mesobacillus maritimus]|uniref:hypothetical protein n=1 Tax=Mesobacillus maritimus TaxID=1643336 RepID=UPI00203D101E|nr:hypothetical protein [Mesobacillus maritimus]MCM3585599.1 hypothetical protein [Mesobacillus maritimus]MCM3669071.1 hypothetical protein [Mesobacillus maritimus]